MLKSRLIESTLALRSRQSLARFLHGAANVKVYSCNMVEKKQQLYLFLSLEMLAFFHPGVDRPLTWALLYISLLVILYTFLTGVVV